MATAREKKKIILDAKEPLLTMGYLKNDGSFRTIEFRMNVPGKMGGEIRYDPDAKGGIIIYDMNCARNKKTKTCHRTVKLRKIAWIIADGTLYDFRYNRKGVPINIKDIGNQNGFITIETGEDDVQEGVILDNPMVASYNRFKISNMRISSRQPINIRISSRG